MGSVINFDETNGSFSDYVIEVNGKNYGVRTYGVPNIEIVRRDEIYKHNYFYKILANNYLCERTG
jgi:hypothetical protein